MKDQSTGYEIIRTYVRFGFWLTHKNIVVTGRHLIPEDKPIIFAPNHQNALMDPLALVCTNPHQSFWLARADIFKSKRARPILKYLRLIPVYRIRDGKENLTNNKQIFEQVIGILENKQTIALFPEAAHSGKRQMLPHKKAIPRIALEAEEKNHFNLDLQIVPVGIFYSHYWSFNRLLIVSYGEPIAIDKYKEEYTDNPQKAMISLREEIHNRISPITLQINSKTHYSEYENIRQVVGRAYAENYFFDAKPELQLYYAEIDLIKKIEQLENHQAETFENIIAKTTSYFEAIKKAGISDEQIEMGTKTNWFIVFAKFSGIIFLLPFFIFGFVFNGLPFSITRRFFLAKVKDIAFMSTFNFVSGLIVFPLFYLIEAVLTYLLTGSLVIAIITFILMPFGGKIAYQLMGFYYDFYLKFTFLWGNKSRRNRNKKLLKQRKELIELIMGKVNS